MTWPLVKPTSGYRTLSRFETETSRPSIVRCCCAFLDFAAKCVPPSLLFRNGSNQPEHTSSIAQSGVMPNPFKRCGLAQSQARKFLDWHLSTSLGSKPVERSRVLLRVNV